MEWGEDVRTTEMVSPIELTHLISSWKVSFSLATTEGRDPKRAHRTNRVCFRWIKYETRSQKNCHD